MSQLAHSDLFEYLCYGSMTIRIIFYSYSAGIDFRHQNLTTKIDPRTVSVKGFSQFEITLNALFGSSHFI